MLNLFYAGHLMFISTTTNGVATISNGCYCNAEQFVIHGDFIRYTNGCFHFMKQYNKNKSKGKKDGKVNVVNVSVHSKSLHRLT
jgi:hypothetical protein